MTSNKPCQPAVKHICKGLVHPGQQVKLYVIEPLAWPTFQHDIYVGKLHLQQMLFM